MSNYWTQLGVIDMVRYEYRCRCERVVDGDTFVGLVDVGFRIYHRIVLRLARLNAPEAGTIVGDQATVYLRGLIEGREVQVVTTRDRTDRYGRYLAEVVLSSVGSVNALVRLWLSAHPGGGSSCG